MAKKRSIKKKTGGDMIRDVPPKKKAKIVPWKVDLKKSIKSYSNMITYVNKFVVAFRNLYGKKDDFKWDHGSYDNLGVCMLAVIMEESKIERVIGIKKNDDILTGYRGYMLRVICDHYDIELSIKPTLDSSSVKKGDLVFFYDGLPSPTDVCKMIQNGAVVHVDGIRPALKGNYVVGPWRRNMNKGDELTGSEEYNAFMKQLSDKSQNDISVLGVSQIAAESDEIILATCGEANGVAFNSYVYLKRA